MPALSQQSPPASQHHGEKPAGGLSIKAGAYSRGLEFQVLVTAPPRGGRSSDPGGGAGRVRGDLAVAGPGRGFTWVTVCDHPDGRDEAARFPFTRKQADGGEERPDSSHADGAVQTQAGRRGAGFQALCLTRPRSKLQTESPTWAGGDGFAAHRQKRGRGVTCHGGPPPPPTGGRGSLCAKNPPLSRPPKERCPGPK